MQILVFSDSHGLIANMKAVIKVHPQIEYIIHLGDCGTDVNEIAIENRTYIIEAVQGNCDRYKQYPAEKVILLDGKRILITHGHIYGVKYSLSSIITKGLQDKADAVLFGHTHKPLVESREGVLLVNPGSISRSGVASRATYAILNISSAGMQASIHRV